MSKLDELIEEILLSFKSDGIYERNVRFTDALIEAVKEYCSPEVHTTMSVEDYMWLCEQINLAYKRVKGDDR